MQIIQGIGQPMPFWLQVNLQLQQQFTPNAAYFGSVGTRIIEGTGAVLRGDFCVVAVDEKIGAGIPVVSGGT